MPSLKPLLITLLVRGVGRLPLRTARFLGASLGELTYRINSRSAKVTRANLALCLPHLSSQEREQLTQDSLRETGMAAAETCLLWRRGTASIESLIVSSEGVHLAQEALERGKGLLVLGPHLGNWEALGLYLTALGEVTSLYQPPKQEGLNDLIRSGREKAGARLVPTNTKGVAALLKALKSNGISGILPDQNPNDEGSGIYVPFFGHPAFTMVLANKLILRTGCTALFAFTKRIEGGFHLVFREPPPELYSEDQTVAVTALNRGVESLVMEAPAQYQWEYKRFKKVAAGEASYYINI